MTRYVSLVVMIACPLSVAADNTDDVKKELKCSKENGKPYPWRPKGRRCP